MTERRERGEDTGRTEDIDDREETKDRTKSGQR